jgi:hypothetical protein
MRKFIYTIMLASVASVGATGCSNFLSSNDVTLDPNNPSSATAAQLFQGVEASQWTEQEAILAMTSCILIQQCSGRGSGRFLDNFTQYTFSAQDFSFDYGQMYLGGGLVDIRTIESATGAAGNVAFRGIARIYEALVMSTAAGIWGDIPWTQAGDPNNVPYPTLDRQFDIYNGLLTLLDGAITDLSTPLGGANTGPGPVDLVFARFDASTDGATFRGQWTRVAHTLKARINMHMAEVNGAAAYNAAITEALLGINNINESFRAQHSTTANEGNQWWQFNVTAFGRDLTIGPGMSAFLNHPSRLADARWAEYYALPGRCTTPATCMGTASGSTNQSLVDAAKTWTTDQWKGFFVVITGPDTVASGWTQVASIDSNRADTLFIHGLWARNPTTVNTYTITRVVPTVAFLEGTRNAAAFNQPIVAWEENQLILAEATCAPAQPVVPTTVCAASAGFLNAVRTANGLGAIATPTIRDIMEEKYVAMFQNIETWSDYKRSCIPALVPDNGSFGPPTQIPGRLYYGDAEVNGNPGHYPDTAGELTFGGSFVSGQTIVGFRNPDDPNPCP